MVCRVPVNADETCGKAFFPGEERAFNRHVAECAQANAEAIHAASPRTRLEVLEPWDPEIAAHMKKVGERMLEEGRLEVKPSERAGF